MKMIGLDCGAGRPPNPPFSEEKVEQLKADLDEVGFWDVAVKK